MTYSVILYSWIEYTRPENGETSTWNILLLRSCVALQATNGERSPSSKFHFRSGQDLALPELVVHCPSSALQMLIHAIQSGSTSRDEPQS
jgi:hypothetical protein